MLFCFILFIFCFFLIVLYNSHYMMLLLILEILLLSIFIFLAWLGLSTFGMIGLFVFLLVMVCMGGFSISLLVSVSRHFGRDFWNMRNIF